jgi:hypothetical protein
MEENLQKDEVKIANIKVLEQAHLEPITNMPPKSLKT